MTQVLLAIALLIVVILCALLHLAHKEKVQTDLIAATRQEQMNALRNANIKLSEDVNHWRERAENSECKLRDIVQVATGIPVTIVNS